MYIPQGKVSKQSFKVQGIKPMFLFLFQVIFGKNET